MSALADYQFALNSLVANFWTGDLTGHISTQYNGYTSYSTAVEALAPADIRAEVQSWNGGKPDMWCQAQFVNMLFWTYESFGGQDIYSRIENNYSWLQTQYSFAQLEDASPNSLVVHALDDAAWVSMSFLDIYVANGDPQALGIAVNLLNSAYANYTPASGNQHGLYYALPGNNVGHVNVSSLYEVGIALACLRVHDIGGNPGGGWLERAQQSYYWMNNQLKNASLGIFYCEQHLDTNPPQPVIANGPTPMKGHSDFYLGGAIGMAVLGIQLYNATKQAQYLTNVKSLVDAIVANYQDPDSQFGYNVLLNDRDAWTETFFLPAFVKNVLPALGTNPPITQLIKNTANSIINHCRTSDGYYTADWVPGTYWSSTGQTDRIRGMANAQQLMTSTTTVTVLLASAMIG